MKIYSLASGSKGNAYCVEAQGKILLIDCGLSCRELTSRMKKVGLDIEDIIAVVFTHNHIDHIKGVATFNKKYPEVELYANLMTAEAIAHSSGIEEQVFLPFENGQSFDVGPFSIEPFSIPHDVPDPVGYLVTADGETYFHVTDAGTPLDSIGYHLSLAEVAILESNHDLMMLQQSNRTEALKQRIRGPRGHLSNYDTAELVGRFASPKLKRLALAHLSRECNSPHLVEREIKATLRKIKREDIVVTILSQEECFEV